MSTAPNLPAQRDIQAKVTPGSIQPIEPQSYNEVIQFADLAVKAGYFQLRNVQDAALRILYGREMGLSTMQSLMGVQIVEGNPGLKAHVIAARVQQSGVWDYNVVKWDNTVCEIEFLKHGKYYNKSTFTVEDGLRSKGVPDGGWFKPLSNWDKFTKAMLFARALTQGVRAFCPEVFMGPVYASEELSEGVEDIDFTIAPKKSAADLAATGEPDEKSETVEITENEKCRRIDDWAARAAKRMKSMGQPEYESAGAIVVAMHEALEDDGHIQGSADTYRSRVKEIACHAEWSVIQERLGGYMKRLQDGLKTDEPPETEPEPKPAPKAPRKRQTTPKPRPGETMTVVSETVGHVIEEAPFEDQPAEDTRIRPRVQPASKPETPSSLGAAVKAIEAWAIEAARKHEDEGLPDLADKASLLDRVYDVQVRMGTLPGGVKGFFSQANALAKLAIQADQDPVAYLEESNGIVREEYLGVPDAVDTADPEQDTKSPAKETPAEKLRAIEIWFDNAAAEMGERGHRSLVMPSSLVAAVYAKAHRTGLIPGDGKATGFRTRLDDIAQIPGSSHDVIQKMKPFCKALIAELEKPEPGSEG